jgi:hypothetical protein
VEGADGEQEAEVEVDSMLIVTGLDSRVAEPHVELVVMVWEAAEHVLLELSDPLDCDAVEVPELAVEAS